MAQVDGPADLRGSRPVQGPSAGAGTSSVSGWDPSRGRSFTANSIMERTVLVKFTSFDEVTRGQFHSI